MGLKKIFKVFKEVMPIITTLLSAYLVYKCPITIFSFIPQDKIYSTSLSVYSLLILGIFKLIEYGINSFEAKKARIILEFSLLESKYGDNKAIDCYFNTDTAKIFVNIYIDSPTKKVKENVIKIILPSKVDAQPIEKYSNLYTINKTERTIEIEVAKLINENMKRINGENTEIGFQIIKNTSVVNSGTEILLFNKKQTTQFEFNKLFFKE